MKDARIPELLTISEAAERMHVSRQTIYTWIREGKILPVLTPGGRRRISEDQLIIPGLAAAESVSVLFPIRSISELDPARIEQMGTREKYWFSRTDKHWYWASEGDEFLFKAGREGTGENWAEKVVSELCTLLELPHAEYDLAIYRRIKGVITPKFVPYGACLRHGNEILPNYISNYQKSKRYHQTQHTVKAVFDTLSDKRIQLPIGWSNQSALNSATNVFTGYLMLDVWIANTDRHHENWGVIDIPERKSSYLAPTFDHASSLGRNVTDNERKERLTTRDTGRNMNSYVQKAKSAFYLNQYDRRLLSTLGAFQEAASKNPDAAKYWLSKLEQVPTNDVKLIVDKVPNGEMSHITKEFTLTILELNRQRLLANKV